MHYKKSKEILQLIKSAKRILVNCHTEPDSDSIGSALSMAGVFKKYFKKKVKVVCRDEIPEGLRFMKDWEKVEIIDYEKFDFNKWDLFLSLDSSDWGMVVGRDFLPSQPVMNLINIDHHISNKLYGNINLVDTRAGGVCEMLYLLFEDWNLKINESVAYNLLAGIIADTGCFRYDNATERTFKVASDLLKLGGNKSEVNFYIYQNIEFDRWKYWAKIFENSRFDKKLGLVWSTLSHEEFVSLGSPRDVSVGGMFFQNVKDSSVGIFMEEIEKEVLNVSFRSRLNVDVSKIAGELGGGGHFRAAGAKVRGMKFKDAVEKVLKVARKYSK